jgi:putative phosphoesterase
MRIGVISDTHVADKAWQLPDKIAQDFKGVDMIIHAGDLVDLSVLEKLKLLCPDVRAVCGNMDPAEISKVLAEKEIIQAGKFKIGLMHGRGAPSGLPDLLTETFRADKVDLIIFGHSHNPFNEQRSGVILFNPGSATDKVYAAYNSYGIIEVNDKIETRIVKL